MTNTANLENCKKLFELSGWIDPSAEGRSHVPGAPYYTLGYLLRKLPPFTRLWLNGNTGDWVTFTEGDKHGIKANTPEDALCLLAITLFEQGILQKDTA